MMRVETETEKTVAVLHEVKEQRAERRAEAGEYGKNGASNMGPFYRERRRRSSR